MHPYVFLGWKGAFWIYDILYTSPSEDKLTCVLQRPIIDTGTTYPMSQSSQHWGHLIMQQHRHETEYIKPRIARTGHERQMLADVWQQDMCDEVSIVDVEQMQTGVRPDGLVHPDRGAISLPPAVPRPVEEEEEEEPAAGDTFMVSAAANLSCSQHRLQPALPKHAQWYLGVWCLGGPTSQLLWYT